MSLHWSASAITAILGGVASHRLVLIYGELDEYGVAIASAFAACWALTSVHTSLRTDSLLLGFFLGTLLFLLLLLGLGASIFVYRLWQHPLRTFPGQTLYILTQWRATYQQSLDERYFAVLREQHRRHGDFVRAGPNHISVNTVEALKPVYDACSLCKRGPWHVTGGQKYILQRTRDRQAHDQERVFWLDAFDDSALGNYADRINEQITHLLDRLPNQEAVVNLTDELKFYGFNAMSTTTISRSFNEAERFRIMRLMNNLESGQRLLGIFGNVPYAFSLLNHIPGILDTVSDLFEATKDLLDFRLRETPSTPDIISFLLEAQNNPAAPGFPLFGEFRLAFTAGSLLNSYVPLVVFYFLSKHPDTLRAVQVELAPATNGQKLGGGRKDYSVIDSVIKESLRLMPPFANGGQMTTPPLGLRIGDTYIPGDVIIKVPMYTLMRDERYFEDPDSFVPERWTTRKGMVRNAEACWPFLLGAYSCVAKDFAMMQTRAVIARVVSAYDLAFMGPEDFEQSGKDRYIMVYGPLLVKLTPRKGRVSNNSATVTGWPLWNWRTASSPE